ncbi:hypothetical protein [Cellulomonas sp. KH9]|uniref:hypothetical protein n=1 Tax=Cellulomonas sp. KH9 TaxID=1855324 RepID=UPI0011603CD5|nr:hypothetical protein [Cellulomonas sp. KH9]
MLRMSKEKVSLVDGTCAERFSRPVEQLGQDEHGTWLGARQGNPVRQPDGRHEAQEHDAVRLVVEDAWSLPAFWPRRFGHGEGSRTTATGAPVRRRVRTARSVPHGRHPS